MAATIKSRIDRGVKLLDAKAPGWVYKVKLTELDLSSGDDCVLGQVFGEYVEGLDALGIDGGGEPYGFDTNWLDVDRKHAVKYAVLTERWKAVIRERRGNSGTRGRR